MNNLTYIDLFSGAGGFSLGFDNAGFTNIFSIDIEPNFCKTYTRNFPNHTLVTKDISKLTNDEILNLVTTNNVDVVIGGPPCQGFSIAGNIGRKFIEDPRNRLFKEFARVVEVVKPKHFVMENVARLFTHNKGQTKIEIINTFQKMGYKVESKILNSADYGVPQVRRRAIFIGTLSKNDLKFPEKSVDKYLTVKEAIGHFPIIHSGEVSDVINHKAMNHSEQMLLKMGYVTDGGCRDEIPLELRPKSGDVRKYIKYKSDAPAVCITGDMRKVFHYEQNRALSARELATLQSFPESFIFEGPSISQQQQIGNSVPPMMAEALANVIKDLSNKND